MWKTLLHSTLFTAKADSSIFSLSKAAAVAKTEINNNSKKARELEHCLNKAATQIGNLKTSQLENNYKAMEAQIRIHNITKIKTTTKEDFRSITKTKQEEEIEKILHKHSGEAKAGTIEIFRPRTGGKQFEPLALINFKHPP